MAKPTLSEVAREAGVHPATASRALNPALPGRITEETTARVREAAARLGYRPDLRAQSLRTRRSRTIGVLLPDVSNPFFPRVVRGIEDVLRAEGYEAIIANTDNDEAREAALLDVLNARHCDGFLVATAFRHDENVAGLVREGVPTVLINRLVDDVTVPSVVSDDAAGMRAAVRHLMDRGHTSIAYLAGPRSLSITATRVSAFTAELRARGVPRPATRVLYGAGYTMEAGEEAARRLLDGPHGRATAVIAGNDMMAIGCLGVLAERGIACPGEMSVVGFNDMPLAARLRPALTTVSIPQYELGAEAARLLLRRLVEPEGEPETRRVPTRLVARETVAAARER